MYWEKMILFNRNFFSNEQNTKEKNGSYWLNRIYYFWNHIYDIECKKWRQLGIVRKYYLDNILYPLVNSLF